MPRDQVRTIIQARISPTSSTHQLHPRSKPATWAVDTTQFREDTDPIQTAYPDLQTGYTRSNPGIYIP